jgi:hypothetical protein
VDWTRRERSTPEGTQGENQFRKSRINRAAKNFVEAGGVETYQDFFTDDQGWSRTAAVGAHEFEYRGLVAAYVALFVDDASRREVGLN